MKKDKRFFNVEISDELIDRLEAYSESSGVLKKKIFELAMTEYLSKKERVKK